MDARVTGKEAASMRTPRRAWGCLFSTLAFFGALAGVGFFCAQAWLAMGPLDAWRISGPFIVLGMPWGEIAGYLALALGCGALACIAFLAGGARTGALAERRNPLLPRHR